MFAQNRKAASAVMTNLYNDDFISPQGLIIRKYTPLKTFEIGGNNLPFTNEFRFFMLGETILSCGYYWSIAEKPELGSLDANAYALVEEVAKICSKHVNFYVIDIAQKEDGDWVVVELNDATMSGLSMNQPIVLYRNLRKHIEDFAKGKF